jgi:serine/threonine protein kinase
MASEPSVSSLKAECEVFISYARQDAERVLEIARLLEGQGATVWRDEERILGGQYYGEQIAHALAHSRVVMLMCSPNSLHSDNVHREVLLTWDYYHRRYIPVWLCSPTEIPERFRYCLSGCQWIDAHSQSPEAWLPQLVSALQALGVETQHPSALPAAPPGAATPRPGGPTPAPARRTLQFRPGDKPIKGADWELTRLLGRGGFGEVWKAHNPQLPGMPPVALKFCFDLDERSRKLLRHEADMVLRAQRQIRSEGIVPLLHAYLNNEPPCLEFPYIEGGTLVRLLDERRESAGSFTPAQAQRIVHQIALIVAPAHRATPKLVHRDLKPSNVLVERLSDGKVALRVTDFGIGAVTAELVLERSRSSSSMQENMSSVLTGAYTPLYASPQQIQGGKPDPRDDVYALGVIWYQLLKGELSSPAPTGRKWIDVLRSREMSDQAIDLLSSCFESDPAYRPADAGMLAEQIQALSTSPQAKAAGSALGLSSVGSASNRSRVPGSPRPNVTQEELAAPPPPAAPSPTARGNQSVVVPNSRELLPLIDEPSPAQPSRQDQRFLESSPSAAGPLPSVESTAVALDWLLHGGFAFCLAGILATWILSGLGDRWWISPLNFALVAFAVAASAIWITGFSRWRVFVAAAAGSTLLVLIVSVANRLLQSPGENTSYLGFLEYLVYGAYIALISGYVNRVSLRRSLAAVLLGPAVGLLVAGPLILILTFLGVGLSASSTPAENQSDALVWAAVAWSILVVLASTTPRTVCRFLSTNQPLTRGILAFALAFAAAAVLVLMVTIPSQLLPPNRRWMLHSVTFIAASQAIPLLVRGSWRFAFSRFVALAALATGAVVLVVNWLARDSASYFAAWVVLSSAPLLVNLQTVDLFAHGAEVFERLRQRLRTRWQQVRSPRRAAG